MAGLIVTPAAQAEDKLKVLIIGGQNNHNWAVSTPFMQQVLDKRPESVTVIIDEVDPENWGQGGEPVTEIRRRSRGSTQA